MKIGEAQQIYRQQIREYREQKASLSKQLQTVRSRMEHLPDKSGQFSSEAVTLELTIDALSEKEDEYQEYLDKLADQYCAYWNATVADQQADAAKEYAIDMGKILEVARRLMKGAIVPATDERKLMEFDFELYQTAKNIGSMAKRDKKEEYDSLWGDEEKKEYADPQEAAENAEAASSGPAIINVEEVVASSV